MIIGTGSIFTRIKYSRKYKAEEEFYIRLQDNPVYPFEDIGFGFYYLRVRSDRIMAGICVILIAIGFMSMFSLVIGIFALPLGLFIVTFCFGLLTLYGNLSVRELVINRDVGYLLRIQANEKVLAEYSVHNVYIRLQEKYDTVGMKWYYLILGGYHLDDIRLTRMTQNQSAMRGMGRRLAKSLGINYFDYNNITTRHVIFHYSTYSIKDALDDHYGDSDEEEVEDVLLEQVVEVNEKEEMSAIEEATINYEKYVSKQLLDKHFEETEDVVLDELYYTAIIKAGEVIRENVSREEKIAYLHEMLTKDDIPK